MKKGKREEVEKPKARERAEKESRRRPARSKRAARAGAETAGAGRETQPKLERPAPPGGLPWEDLGVLRETFLAYITSPEDAMALRQVARLFYLLVLEGAKRFPNQHEAQVTLMLRAAALDLKGLSAYLAAREPRDEDPFEDREDLAHHVLADQAAKQLAELAAELAEAAGEPPEQDRA